MYRNIKLLYIIYFLNNLWFWMGIWLIYYLNTISYVEVGIIGSFSMLVGIIIEIPTGAIADLIGRKNTLIISFFMSFLGILAIGFANGFVFIFCGAILTAIGGALFSGTTDALLYDSLKSLSREIEFNKTYSKIQSFNLIAIAIASVIGGFAYSYSIYLPWILRAISLFLALITTIFIIEPKIDSEKFNLLNFIKQNKEGFKYLFSKKMFFNGIFEIFLIASFIKIIADIIDNAYAIELGYNSSQQGILFAVIYLLSSLSIFFFTKHNFKNNQLVVLFSSISILLVTLISPILTFGLLVLLARNIIYPIFDINAKDIINQNTQSKDRATTISTYALIQNIPYLFLGVFAGAMLEKMTSSSFSSLLSIIYIVIYGLFLLFRSIVRMKVSLKKQ